MPWCPFTLTTLASSSIPVDVIGLEDFQSWMKYHRGEREWSQHILGRQGIVLGNPGAEKTWAERAWSREVLGLPELLSIRR